MSRVFAVLSALALGVLSACGSKGGASPCTSDAESTDGARCPSGSCQSKLRPTITSPAEAVTHTRGPVHVEVEVSAGAVQSVELLVDDVSLATVSRPFHYDWDTTGVPEGTHRLVARISAGSQHHDSTAKRVVVDRTAPAGPAVNARSPTNLRPASVSGTTEPHSKVTLFEGDAVIGEVAAGAGGAWSTALDLAQGSHGLAAGATDLAGNSTPAGKRSVFTIEVDQTPLQIVARTPDPEDTAAASNVWSRDPITVTFNKALDPATVTTSAIRLVDGNGATLPVQTPALSSDATSIRLAPVALPDVPNTLTLTLGDTIADRAGNRLTASQWSWAIPDWQSLGDCGKTLLPLSGATSSSYYYLVTRVDGAGGVLLGAADGDARQASTLLQVVHWNDGAWRTFMSEWVYEIDGGLSADIDANDHPAVAWNGGGWASPYVLNPHAVLWSGPAGTVGTQISSEELNAQPAPPGLRLDGNGGASLAWCSSDGRLLASSWASGSWSATAATNVSACDDVRIVGPGPLVSWRSAADSTGAAPICTGIAQGAGWAPTCTTTAAGATYGLARVPAGDRDGPYHVFDTSSAGSYELHVKRYACLSASCEYRGWQDVGQDPLNVERTQPVSAPAMDLDGGGDPVVAWVEGDSTLYVKRWNGNTWVPLGGNVRTDAEPGAPSRVLVAVGRTGVVAVVWVVNGGPYGRSLYVKRYNG